MKSTSKKKAAPKKPIEDFITLARKNHTTFESLRAYRKDLLKKGELANAELIFKEMKRLAKSGAENARKTHVENEVDNEVIDNESVVD